MTSKAQITKVASRDGVDARIVERDYVLAHIVALIASHVAEERLIFKGGTSLRLLHFGEYRYSADLDYSVIRGSEAEAREVIRGALGKERPDTIKALSLDGSSDRILYVGPLGTERMIKLDLADDELVVNTEKRSLRKAAHKGLDPATFAEKFEKRVKDYEKRWDQELGEYLGDVPHFEEVDRNVRRALRRAQLL